MKIVVVGSGYVGLTSGAIFAKVGHDVVCIDTDPNKIDTINSGRSHFFEPGLDPLIASAVSCGRLTATSDYQLGLMGAELVFMCVGTPANPDGSSNLAFVESALISIAKHQQSDIAIIQKSTVPVGTASWLRSILRKYSNSDFRSAIVSSPEFLREGSAVFDTIFFDRLVIGLENEPFAVECQNKIIRLYKNIDKFSNEIDKHEDLADIYAYANHNLSNKNVNPLPFDDRLFISSIESAELIKVSANAFLAMKISFANLIARLCDQTGADVRDVMDAVGADKRIGRSFLSAGLGFGGGCFPKDVSALISTLKNHKIDSGLFDAVLTINHDQVDVVVSKLHGALGELDEKKIVVLGISFKPGTSDIRQSPAVSLIKKLTQIGALVTAHDPQAMDEFRSEYPDGMVALSDNMYDALQGADALVIATDWQQFKDIELEKVKSSMRGNVIVDCWNSLDGKITAKSNFVYFGIGRRTPITT